MSNHADIATTTIFEGKNKPRVRTKFTTTLTGTVAEKRHVPGKGDYYRVLLTHPGIEVVRWIKASRLELIPNSK